jgi:hypothetical protein
MIFFSKRLRKRLLKKAQISDHTFSLPKLNQIKILSDLLALAVILKTFRSTHRYRAESALLVYSHQAVITHVF